MRKSAVTLVAAALFLVAGVAGAFRALSPEPGADPIVAAALQRIDSPYIRAARIGPSPERAPGERGAWLYVEALRGFTVTVRGQDGGILDRHEEPLANPAAVVQQTDQEAMRKVFAERTQEAGYEIVSLTFEGADRASPRLTIKADDSERFMAQAGRIVHTIMQEDREYPSRVLKVVDRSGSVFMVSTFNRLTQSGAVWVKPGLSACAVAYGCQPTPAEVHTD